MVHVIRMVMGELFLLANHCYCVNIDVAAMFVGALLEAGEYVEVVNDVHGVKQAWLGLDTTLNMVVPTRSRLWPSIHASSLWSSV